VVDDDGTRAALPLEDRCSQQRQRVRAAGKSHQHRASGFDIGQ
jgi:hypothetical protein